MGSNTRNTDLFSNVITIALQSDNTTRLNIDSNIAFNTNGYSSNAEELIEVTTMLNLVTSSTQFMDTLAQQNKLDTGAQMIQHVHTILLRHDSRIHIYKIQEDFKPQVGIKVKQDLDFTNQDYWMASTNDFERQDSQKYENTVPACVNTVVPTCENTVPACVNTEVPACENTVPACVSTVVPTCENTVPACVSTVVPTCENTVPACVNIVVPTCENTVPGCVSTVVPTCKNVVIHDLVSNIQSTKTMSTPSASSDVLTKHARTSTCKSTKRRKVTTRKNSHAKTCANTVAAKTPCLKNNDQSYEDDKIDPNACRINRRSRRLHIQAKVRNIQVDTNTLPTSSIRTNPSMLIQNDDVVAKQTKPGKRCVEMNNEENGILNTADTNKYKTRRIKNNEQTDTSSDCRSSNKVGCRKIKKTISGMAKNVQYNNCIDRKSHASDVQQASTETKIHDASACNSIDKALSDLDAKSSNLSVADTSDLRPVISGPKLTKTATFNSDDGEVVNVNSHKNKDPLTLLYLVPEIAASKNVNTGSPAIKHPRQPIVKQNAELLEIQQRQIYQNATSEQVPNVSHAMLEEQPRPMLPKLPSQIAVPLEYAKILFPDKYSHISVPEKADQYRCEICFRLFSSFALLYMHMSTNKHGNLSQIQKTSQHTSPKENPKPHICGICKRSFEKHIWLKIHQVVHEDDMKCIICGKDYAGFSEIRRHVLSSHLEIDAEKCVICERRFIDSRKLAAHKHSVHGNSGKNPFKCEPCNRQFHTPSLLKRHRISFHGDEKQFQCHICGHKFSVNAELRHHLNLHAGIKPFKCQVCEKHFATNTHLKTHMLSHTGIKPHMCDTCGKMFSTAGNMRNHKKTHSKGQ